MSLAFQDGHSGSQTSLGTALRPQPKLVSVVIPSFNQGRFLAEAIASAQAQTWPAVEIVVVDDGSTDDTPEVAACYPDVRYIRQRNAGVSAARNAGARASSGDYLVFLDGDDVLTPTALERAMDCVARNPDSAIVYGNHTRVSLDGRVLTPPWSRAYRGNAYAALLARNCIGMIAAAVFRRDVFEKVGGFDESLRLCEDYELYLRIARRHSIAHFNEIAAEYRQHDDCVSHDYGGMMRKTLEVQWRELTFVKHDAALRAQLDQGLDGTRVYFTWRLWEAFREAVSLRRSGLALRYGAELLWRHPDFLFPKLRRYVTEAATARLPRALVKAAAGGAPPAGRVDFGDFRRTTPFAVRTARGKPLDQVFVERFMTNHTADIKGRVLEARSNEFSLLLGQTRVTQSDVFDDRADNMLATFIAPDLGDALLPSAAFDCVILNGVIEKLPDCRDALAAVSRILKPGGVLLLTASVIGPMDGAHRHYTATGFEALIRKTFPDADATVETFGNVLTASAHLFGLSERDLPPSDLALHDPAYPVIVAARVRVPA